MTRRAAKPTTAIPIPTALNISALAREHGVSRKTITRRLAKGWRPGVPSAPSAPSAPTPRIPVQTHPKRPVRIAIADHEVVPVVRAVKPTPTHERPPLGVVRTVLLLLGVAFYVFIGLAAVHR